MKYVKKPVVVEAFQFGVDEWPEWFRSVAKPRESFIYDKDVFVLEQIGESIFCRVPSDWNSNEIHIKDGDFIVKSVPDRNIGFRICDKEHFDVSYEPYNEEQKNEVR